MTAKKPISNPENYLKDIRRKTRRIFTAEQKILIVMEALRAETSVVTTTFLFSGLMTAASSPMEISEEEFFKLKFSVKCLIRPNSPNLEIGVNSWFLSSSIFVGLNVVS